MTVARASSYALRFVGGAHKGGEFPLRPNREIIIGRGSEYDMVLDEDLVSRRHARISTFHGQIILQDLQSTNGTFVNGERITVARLKPGDKVLIGNSAMELVESDRAPISFPPGEAAATFDPGAATRHGKEAPVGATVDGDPFLSGRIPDGGVGVADLVELYHGNRRSGVLTLRDPAGTEGRIFLREGNVYYATLSGTRAPIPPAKAFFRIVGWPAATYRLDPRAPLPPFDDELTQETPALLAETLGQWDQLAPYREHLPSADQRLALARPLEPKLSALSAEALDTLQLALNHGEVAEVLDRSEAADHETWFDVLYLLQNGYLVLS